MSDPFLERHQVREALEEIKAKLAANPNYQPNPYERSMMQRGLDLAVKLRAKPPRRVKAAAERLGLRFERIR